MNTLTIPDWPANLTKKYWAKNKSASVKKTGVGDKIAKAETLFAKIKWDLFDPSKAKVRTGCKPAIEKAHKAQIGPLQVILGDIFLLADKAGSDSKADDKMRKLCKDTSACAKAANSALLKYLQDALDNAAEYDKSSQNYAADITAFIKGFSVDLKALENEAKVLAAKAAQTEKYLQACSFTEGPLTAEFAQKEAAAVSKAGNDLEKRRAGYQQKMGVVRNIKPGDYGLTTQDVQQHEQLMLMTRRIFEHFDKLYAEITEAVDKAVKCAKDAQLFIAKGKSDIAKWRQKVASDLASLEAILDKITTATTTGWGSQISKKGGVFGDTIKMLAAAKPNERQGLLGGAIKRVQDASVLMPKTRNIVNTLLASLTKNLFAYKKAIPEGLQFSLVSEIKDMENILRKAEKNVADFEKNYVTSMKMLQTLDTAIKKYSK